MTIMRDHVDDPLNAFRSSELKPENYSREECFYQLTNVSVNPTRVVGRDKLGRPIEETVPVCGGMKWVHPCGAINNVPMFSGPGGWFEPEHRNYKQTQVVRLLVSGWLPLEVCPYSREYRSITGTPCLVDNPDKIEDCGGHPDGCEHLKPIIAERSQLARERHEEMMREAAAMTPAQAAQLLRDVSQAMTTVETMAGGELKPQGARPPRPGNRFKQQGEE